MSDFWIGVIRHTQDPAVRLPMSGATLLVIVTTAYLARKHHKTHSEKSLNEFVGMGLLAVAAILNVPKVYFEAFWARHPVTFFGLGAIGGLLIIPGCYFIWKSMQTNPNDETSVSAKAEK